MALLNLIFGGPTKVEIGSMELDASISESHERTATISRNALEDGNYVQDHVTLEPIRLTIEGLISDSPLTLFSSLTGTAVGAGGKIVNDVGGGFLAGTAAAVGLGVALGSLAKMVQKPPRKPEEAFKFLEDLWAARATFKIVTGLREYEDMVMSTLRVPKNASVGKSLRFTASFEKIRVVTSEVVSVPRFAVDSPTVDPNKTVNEGKKGADKLPADSPRASILDRFVNIGTGG